MIRRRPRGRLRLTRKSETQRRRALEILAALDERYPDPKCELDHASPHELLIATILSAQSTDVGVNKATPALFAAFRTPEDFARAGAASIEPYLRTLNFWRMKAKAVAESMRAVSERFGGEVPRTMAELLTLRGVARKTANVVLGTAFGINEGVVVDTHVLRLSRRLGLSRSARPEVVERDLMALFPRERWADLSHMLILHGRRVCKARGGSCINDPVCRRWCSETTHGRRSPTHRAKSGAAPRRPSSSSEGPTPRRRSRPSDSRRALPVRSAARK